MEEAYRRKCIQLRARTKEIEDENDAYRLRLTRLKRQIQKVRLERAILLEQIAKRTSTNVEDSDGSPSPPPTVRAPLLPHTPLAMAAAAFVVRRLTLPVLLARGQAAAKQARPSKTLHPWRNRLCRSYLRQPEPSRPLSGL